MTEAPCRTPRPGLPMTIAPWLGVSLLAALFLNGDPARGQDRTQNSFGLKDGETVVFFGDSITQNGHYIVYIETFLRTRFPHHTFHLVNRGISSETVSGTTEPDHDPPRPDAMPRFARDVASQKPDVVVACFGMNDGNYFPFEPSRFERFQAGVQKLIRRTRDEATARLVLMTPPPFDPYRRRVADPNAANFGYKFPAIDYDETLRRYSRWLVELARTDGDAGDRDHPDLRVADVHTASNEHLRRRRQKRVSFFLAGDAVHPGPTGHWLMAQTLLETWSAPPLVSTAEIDAAKRTSVSPGVAKIRSGDEDEDDDEAVVLRFDWNTPLPMAVDPAWDAESIALERVSDRLNRHTLRIVNLPPGRYELVAGPNGPEPNIVAEIDAVDLVAGVDLTGLPKFPTNRQALAVLEKVRARQRTLYQAWRESLKQTDAAGRRQILAAAETAAQKLELPLATLCRPRTWQITLRRKAEESEEDGD